MYGERQTERQRERCDDNKPVCFSSSFPATLRRSLSSERQACRAVLVGLWLASFRRPWVVSASRPVSRCWSWIYQRLLPWRPPRQSYVEMAPALIPASRRCLLKPRDSRRTSQTCCESPTSSDCCSEWASSRRRYQQQQQQLSASVTRQTTTSTSQFSAKRTEIIYLFT